MRLAIKTLGGVTLGSAYPTVEKFIGFDSFEGMPQPSEFDQEWTHLRGGDNATSVEEFMKLCGPKSEDVLAVKGYFSESLVDPRTDQNIAEFLSRQTKSSPRPQKTHAPSWFSFCYVDVDYYESTLETLNYAVPRIVPGGLLLLDDWNLYRADPNRGQRKALYDFSQENSATTLVPLWNTGWGGKVFSVLKRAAGSGG